jgi:hypothetical protein
MEVLFQQVLDHHGLMVVEEVVLDTLVVVVEEDQTAPVVQILLVEVADLVILMHLHFIISHLQP